jgi:hypothetical protein
MNSADPEYDFELEFKGDHDSANLHLCLAEDVLARLDEARRFKHGFTREDLATAAILWALRNLEEEIAITMMNLGDDTSRS